MGMFSWLTSDTEESISNQHSYKGALPVKMLAPDGRVWVEENYEGYGVFGGKDFFALVDELNGGTGDRVRGIDIQDLRSTVLPRLVTIGCKTPYERLDDNLRCPDQGFFYSEDEEEEEYYEDEEE